MITHSAHSVYVSSTHASCLSCLKSGCITVQQGQMSVISGSCWLMGKPASTGVYT